MSNKFPTEIFYSSIYLLYTAGSGTYTGSNKRSITATTRI